MSAQVTRAPPEETAPPNRPAACLTPEFPALMQSRH